MYESLSLNLIKMVPVGNAAAIRLSGLGGGVTPPQQFVFSGWGGLTPPAATAFPGCIAPAPASQEFPGRVFPENKSPC